VQNVKFSSLKSRLAKQDWQSALNYFSLPRKKSPDTDHLGEISKTRALKKIQQMKSDFSSIYSNTDHVIAIIRAGVMTELLGENLNCLINKLSSYTQSTQFELMGLEAKFRAQRALVKEVLSEVVLGKHNSSDISALIYASEKFSSSLLEDVLGIQAKLEFSGELASGFTVGRDYLLFQQLQDSELQLRSLGKLGTVEICKYLELN
jgi:hypothetical protein